MLCRQHYSTMKLLALAACLALLCAVVNAAALTDREKSLIHSLADELRYHETGQGRAENVDEQGTFQLFDHGERNRKHGAI